VRFALLLLSVGALLAQQPLLYHRGTVNAASFAPFGLPNAPIARGSVFTVFGEKLGPATPQTVSVFPLQTVFGEVSLSVTQNGVMTAAIPIFVSSGQINAIMPSSIKKGLATFRLTYQSRRSNAIPLQISDSAPGVFAVSGGGYGPGIVQNYLAQDNQPINSLVKPAAPGQTLTIWGTGLGPVTFPDNVAPTVADVATSVTVTVGGHPVTKLYSGRSPCCSGVDQMVVTLPADVPLGCWVPIAVNAGGAISNTVTMAIASPGAASCDDPGNPLSTLVRTPGSQAFIHAERFDSVENVQSAPPVHKVRDQLYSRFYTRPDSPYNFDPYLSYPPTGTCLVHQANGDASADKTLRGVLPGSASLKNQPKQTYNNGTQAVSFTPRRTFFSSTVGGTIDTIPVALNLLAANAAFTIDPAGPNEKVIPLSLAAPPGWTRPDGVLAVPRDTPFAIAFTPGDPAAPTAILLYSYSAVSNATVEVQCLAPAGATTFTIPAESLANLPPTYDLIDGSYTNLFIGTVALNHAVAFSSPLATSAVLLNSNWLAQSVVIQ
jgi:uncharacterized protein (TIGR03437 family)